MICTFSRLCLVYVLSIWFVTQMGYIHITFTWAHPITSGTYLFALPPIIGYIGGIAVRSSVHILYHHNHHNNNNNNNNDKQRVEDDEDSQKLPRGTLTRRKVEVIGRAVECQESKCMSPEYLFSDQQSISSGIGGAIHSEEIPHFNGQHLTLFERKSTTAPTTSSSHPNQPTQQHPSQQQQQDDQQQQQQDDNNIPSKNVNSYNSPEKSVYYPPSRKLRNVARCAHWNVNERMPKSYYDYENYYFAWQLPDQYEIIRKIGRGKYSEVFLGVHLNNHNNRDYKIFSDIPLPPPLPLSSPSSTKTGDMDLDAHQDEEGDIVIKVLKPIPKFKIQREVKILKSLEGGPNIIPLLETVKDTQSKTMSLIFPYVNKTDLRELINYIGDEELKYYMYELLKAVEYTHSKGIMHRDIKPDNIAIDHNQRKLYLLDWGLAEYYHPGKTYNIKVASRHYKPPELLVNMTDYDYSLDMWSLGCVFAGLILERAPFFNGADNDDQLVQITKVLGTDSLYQYLDKYGLELSEDLIELIKPTPKKSWDIFIPFSNDDIAHPVAIDFLDKLLRYDPQERLTAKEAMNHPYFSSLHKPSSSEKKASDQS